jgi:hypothetical protein
LALGKAGLEGQQPWPSYLQNLAQAISICSLVIWALLEGLYVGLLLLHRWHFSKFLGDRPIVWKWAKLAQNDVDAINRIRQLEETISATTIVQPLSAPEATVRRLQTAVVLPQLPMSNDRWKPRGRMKKQATQLYWSSVGALAPEGAREACPHGNLVVPEKRHRP